MSKILFHLQPTHIKEIATKIVMTTPVAIIRQAISEDWIVESIENHCVKIGLSADWRQLEAIKDMIISIM